MRKKTEVEAGIDFGQYRDNPAGFARDILGSTWWDAQTDIARLLTRHRRVAVKAANGVGKTYLASDLVLWFLYCHTPSVVLTTAPTWRQVESLLWEEVRKRHQAVNARAERDSTQPKLGGSVLQTKLKISDGHFAMGLSTDEPVRFQGFHAENLLVVLDEASGIPDAIWEAVEGVCVGRNNRVLAISNPMAPVGRFYQVFTSPRWRTRTISALDHPNVNTRKQRSGRPRPIPGAVTREAVADRIADWCEPEPDKVEAGSKTLRETFVWKKQTYRPNALFRIRVLGEFPHAAEDGLISLDWIEAAQNPALVKPTEADAVRVLAADVARFGSDETVLACRQGNHVTRLTSYRGLDTMATAGRIAALAREERAEVVAIDVIGVGAGVVDRLTELEIAGVTPVNFAERPRPGRDAELFLNLRAQTYFSLLLWVGL